MRGRGILLCSLRFYASNALAGALYLVKIFVGKDTLAASCGFFALHKGGEMALCFSSLFTRGMAMYLWASRGAGMGGHSQRAHFHSYLQMYSDEGFFIFLLRIRLLSKPMLLLLRC